MITLINNEVYMFCVLNLRQDEESHGPILKLHTALTASAINALVSKYLIRSTASSLKMAPEIRLSKA